MSETEQSVAEKVAGKFGFPNQAPEEPVEPAAPEGWDLELDGAKYHLPIPLKDAFMRNEDYTRKTQELAEQRRTYDQARELASQRQAEFAFGQTIESETREIAIIDAYLNQASRVDWSNMTTDQMLRHKVEIDNVKERRQSLEKSVHDKQTKFQADMQAKMAELRGKTRELATKSIQGFSEETEKEMRKFAVSEGLAEAEVDSVLLDPRSYKIVWKAMQFDKVKAGTDKATETAKTVERVLKPGGASDKMPSETARKLNFRKDIKAARTSGEKARHIESFLEGKFGG